MDVLDFLNQFCNLTTIIFSVIIKVPQIVNILRLKSVIGFSLSSLVLELTSFTILLSYSFTQGYPLMTYLEYPFLVLQDVILLLMALHYTGNLRLPGCAYLGLYFAVSTALTFQMFPSFLLPLLVNICTPVSAASKVVQLQTILKTKDSASVSVTTWVLAAYTCITRIFTVTMETQDVALLMNFFTSLVLNCLIVAAAVYYQSSKQEKRA